MTAVILRCDCIECKIAVALVAVGVNAIAAAVAHSQMVQSRRTAVNVEAPLVTVTAALDGDVAQAGTIAAGDDAAAADLQVAPVAAGVADSRRESDGLRGCAYGRNGAVHEQVAILVDDDLYARLNGQGHAIYHGYIAGDDVGAVNQAPGGIGYDVAAGIDGRCKISGVNDVFPFRPGYRRWRRRRFVHCFIGFVWPRYGRWQGHEFNHALGPLIRPGYGRWRRPQLRRFFVRFTWRGHKRRLE